MKTVISAENSDSGVKVSAACLLHVTLLGNVSTADYNVLTRRTRH